MAKEKLNEIGNLSNRISPNSTTKQPERSFITGQYLEEGMTLRVQAAELLGLNVTVYKPGQKFYSQERHELTVSEGYKGVKIEYQEPEQNSDYWKLYNQLVEEAKKL
jgi:hypothetical protein